MVETDEIPMGLERLRAGQNGQRGRTFGWIFTGGLVERVCFVGGELWTLNAKHFVKVTRLLG